jgi:hypothetical protein
MVCRWTNVVEETEEVRLMSEIGGYIILDGNKKGEHKFPVYSIDKYSICIWIVVAVDFLSYIWLFILFKNITYFAIIWYIIKEN